jgi:hypothetical protein
MARVEGEKGGRGEARGRRAFRRVCSKQPPVLRTCGHCVVLPHPVSPEITVTCTRSVRRTTPAGQAHQTTNLHGRLLVPSGDCRLGSPIGRFGIGVGHAGRPDPVSFIPSDCAAGMAGQRGWEHRVEGPERATHHYEGQTCLARLRRGATDSAIVGGHAYMCARTCVGACLHACVWGGRRTVGCATLAHAGEGPT